MAFLTVRTSTTYSQSFISILVQLWWLPNQNLAVMTARIQFLMCCDLSNSTFSTFSKSKRTQAATNLTTRPQGDATHPPKMTLQSLHQLSSPKRKDQNITIIGLMIHQRRQTFIEGCHIRLCSHWYLVMNVGTVIYLECHHDIRDIFRTSKSKDKQTSEFFPVYTSHNRILSS